MSTIIGIDASRANVVQRTGVEQYAWHVIQELKRIIPAEYRVRLYSREPLNGALADLPAHWESAVLRWPPGRFWTQVRLAWEMFRRPPDVLFVPAHALPVVLPRRSVVTVHDVAFMPHPEAYTLGGAQVRVETAFAARRATRILTVSNFSKSEIMKWFGVAAERIAVTHLGLDASAYRHASAEEARSATEKLGIKGPYFLYVGRLERKKNIAGLFAAFRAFKATRPGDPHSLVLVGKRGRGYWHEMRSVAGAKHMKSVRILGYVKEGQMSALYSGAASLVFPSWYEGFGLPVVEAFACGAPVIAANGSSLPEVGGDAALYADPADPKAIAAAMARVVDDVALRERLIVAGADRVKQFSWATCAEGAWEALRSALKS